MSIYTVKKEFDWAGPVSERVVKLCRMFGVTLERLADRGPVHQCSLQIEPGDIVCITGPSGSGKSTLIRCINRLEEHQKGDILVDGIPLTNDLKKIDEVRREVGMVFQHFNLFPHLTILENCTLAPIWVRKMPKKQAEEVAMHFLKRVKIPEQANKYPGQLSGGQQQRVAIARALVTDPTLIVADEPTGDLDRATGEEVLSLLEQLVGELGKTIVMVTHDPKAAARAGRPASGNPHLRAGRHVRAQFVEPHGLHVHLTPASPGTPRSRSRPRSAPPWSRRSTGPARARRATRDPHRRASR